MSHDDQKNTKGIPIYQLSINKKSDTTYPFSSIRLDGMYNLASISEKKNRCRNHCCAGITKVKCEKCSLHLYLLHYHLTVLKYSMLSRQTLFDEPGLDENIRTMVNNCT